MAAMTQQEREALLAGRDKTSDGRDTAVRDRCEAFNTLPPSRWDALEVIDLREPALV